MEVGTAFPSTTQSDPNSPSPEEETNTLLVWTLIQMAISLASLFVPHQTAHTAPRPLAKWPVAMDRTHRLTNFTPPVYETLPDTCNIDFVIFQEQHHLQQHQQMQKLAHTQHEKALQHIAHRSVPSPGPQHDTCQRHLEQSHQVK